MSENENDNDKTSGTPAVVLDEHRGMSGRQDADARRQRSAVLADQEVLRDNRAALEKQLFAGPATTWPQAAEKACYLLRLFAATGEAQDPRYKKLIDEVMQDLHRLTDHATDPRR